ncbi:acyl-CoA dehydrogenase family protein [Syntrophobacter fumaroxidans]|uniref:Cyclohex-1-ene-1-carbonyl-CoA dehydrogenase n=1 Tax=Syntrophobacter fumaroxidans (strain DSM 10017 / MPOB) TaxID=335543 RepID=A0LI10_SYNFM|nr:acyl-CoA dehydrogenase family protein [Syntrophobacter fumaroxidans]ABK17062.1 Butyryl-CoA dehydrogenase [Syntrophobacter fumaroxidans MPOB]
MDYFLTEEQVMIQELAGQIAREKIRPVRAQLDEQEEFPWEIMKICAQADLFGLYIPEEYGGLGGGILENCLAIEKIAEACIGIATSFAASGLGAYPILLFGSEALKRAYLPDIASGKRLAAFGLTESGAGSDVSGIQTTAVRDGDHYVLNGAKQWITNGGEAEIYSVLAITDRSKGPRGASFFVVEKDDPGFSFGKKEKKLGIRASATRELVFQDCRIPKERLIGREGTGFIVAMKTFDKSRPGIGALGVGLSQGALDISVEYARKRMQFGKPIISFQAIQHKLADMAIKTEAARALIYAAARYMDTDPPDSSKVAAMCKVFAGDAALYAATEAVQILGGYGYMQDYPVEKMMRDAKILQIYEGTNEIQRNIIGQELNKEYSRLKESFF